MPETPQGATVYRFGAYEINLLSGELRKNSSRLKLSGQPFQVLASLVGHAGEIVTREELRASLWQSDTFVDFDHGLNNAVARIRELLSDSSENPRYIETVPRRGYRFIAPVTRVQPPAVSEPAAEIRGSRLEGVAILPASSTQSESPVQRILLSSGKLTFLAGAAFLIACVASLLLYRSHPRTTSRQAIASLAVLPLTNLSGDPAQQYLADGMTEELIGRLAAIRGLRVISRTSVMRFKDTKLSAPEIANTLQVDALVEGSVIRAGSRIRVHAQLIRAAADEHFWSETYDRDAGDVLALESDVAQSIAEKVTVTITGEERSTLVAARHVSPEVYESYLKGNFGAHNNRAEIEESIAQFKDAIQKDPTFAPAYVGLANAYESLSLILVGANPAEMRPKVIGAAKRALELDPKLAEAHALMGAVYQRRWQWSDAAAEYQRALQLKPNDAAAHLGYANWLLCQGRTEEALAWARRARELDPLGTTGTNIGWILFHARRYDEAIRELQSVLAIHADHAHARWYLGFALIGKGEPEKAIPELEKTASLMNRSPGSMSCLPQPTAMRGAARKRCASLTK